MSITSSPSTSPVAPSPQAAPSTSSPQLQSASTPPATALRPPEPAPDAQKSAPRTSAAIGFSLNFDPNTGRMFLEAREPDSGFVIYCMPPKYVVKQFNATVGDVAPARGTQIDGAA